MNTDTLYFCPFSRAILNGKSKCQKAISAHIAERHNINCTEASQSEACQTMIEAAYLRAKFTLKAASGIKGLPNAKKTKLQIGLILGLQELIANQTDLEHCLDIYLLRTQILDTYPTFDDLPYEQIIPHITACNPRKLRSC